MSARKVTISLSPDALQAMDRNAKAEGISRSPWFERAAQRAKRHEATHRSVHEIFQAGVGPASDATFDALRRALG